MGSAKWLATGCALAMAAAAPVWAAGNLNAVLESEVVFLDPHFTTATITRTFNYMVYDTLFAMDSAGAIKPQMVGDYTVSPNRMDFSFALRPGLKFSDGAPVTAADVVASLKRWAPHDGLGRMLMAATGTLEAPDASHVVLKLKDPFPLVLETLGKPNAVTPFIIPERQASLPVAQKLPEVIGSGPFLFRADLWRPGDSMVVERNPNYVPRSEPPDFLAGGKVVKLDRVTMKVIPDANTASQALLQGEIDYLQYVPWDWVDRLKANSGIKLMTLAGLDMFQGNFRLNHASGPFADPAVRQVLWKLVDQDEILQAIGIAPEFHLKDCKSFWMCGTPYGTDAGSTAAHYSLGEAKAMLAKTGYKGEPVVMMEMNTPNSLPPAQVLVAAMRKVGFTVDEQIMDWGTLLQRRAKKDGWSIFAVYSNAMDMYSPLTHFYVSSNCADYAGWSCDPRITPLLAQFVKADTLDARRAIAAQIQTDDYENVPSVMWGQFSIPSAYRTSLTGTVQSSFPIFWAVDKPGK